MAKVTTNQIKNINNFGAIFTTKNSNEYVCLLNVAGFNKDGTKDIGLVIYFSYSNPIISAEIPSRLSPSQAVQVSSLLSMFVNEDNFGKVFAPSTHCNYTVKDTDFSLIEVGPMLVRKTARDCTDKSEAYYRKAMSMVFPYEVPASDASHLSPRKPSDSIHSEVEKEMMQGYEGDQCLDFALSRDEERVIKGVKAGLDRFILLQGYPGTGKTVFARRLAIECQLPLIEIGGGDMTVDDLYGCRTVEPDEDGNMSTPFIPGPLLEAYEKGYVLSFSEMQFNTRSLGSIFYNLVDSTPYIIERTTKRKIHRHPNFCLVLSTNPCVKETHDLTQALFNRFSVVLNYDKDSADTVKDKLLKNRPDMAPALAKALSVIPGVCDSWAGLLRTSGYCSIRQILCFVDALSTYETLTYKDVEDEFKIRIANNVLTGGDRFDLPKIKSIYGSDDFKTVVRTIFDSVDCSVDSLRDADFIVGATGSSDDDSDELSDIYSGVEAVCDAAVKSIAE
jgi:MoxR-like ATPases